MRKKKKRQNKPCLCEVAQIKSEVERLGQEFLDYMKKQDELNRKERANLYARLQGETPLMDFSPSPPLGNNHKQVDAFISKLQSRDDGRLWFPKSEDEKVEHLPYEGIVFESEEDARLWASQNL